MHAIANNMGGLHVGFFMLMLQQLVLASAAEQQQQQQTYYVLDDSSGLGRRFDGIGGLSAGASSRLLVDYPEPQVSEILDFLFKPNFGASLDILKVEIGGDAQSTDGTEPSHMHSATDENYQRGYEWWLMTEAKKRNPDIKLSALSWGFPAWVGEGSGSPYSHPETTSNYIANFIQGAKEHYGLTIDYVGIWNERSYNIAYIETLRSVLDSKNFSHVEIVAADGSFESIAQDVLKHPKLNESVSILGAHYPGTYSTADAEATHKQLWASEDYSTFNDDVGAGCWARILNQNYVNGNMTSTISWSLIASYYEGLPYFRDGLMTAAEPWSGHYQVMGPVWVSAHTTQFSKVGYYYLRHGSGVGALIHGGSYVTLMDAGTKDFSIVIETMSHNHSLCIRPSLPEYTVVNQTASFQLKGSLANITSLNKWVSRISFDGSTPSQYFVKGDPISIIGSVFSVFLEVDTVTTLSTLTGQQKGTFGDIPPSRPFPLPYSDNFDKYAVFSEARYFSDQTGVFEIQKAADEKHGNVMKQMVPTRPITWCNDANQAVALIGNNTWREVQVAVLVLLESVNTSVFVATSMSKSGCDVAEATGTFFWISGLGTWTITSDIEGKEVLSTGKATISQGVWYNLELITKGGMSTASIDGKVVASGVSVPDQPGFVGMGTGGFYSVQFDDFSMKRP